MAPTDYGERLWVSYLLGELSERRREALEQDYFSNRQMVEDLIAVENGLVDDYVRGRLTAADRKRFEQYVLSSERGRRKVRFAIGFLDRISRGSMALKEERALWGFADWYHIASRLTRVKKAIAITAALLLIVTGWLIVQRVRLRSELAALHQSRSAQLERQSEIEKELAMKQSRTNELNKEVPVPQNPGIAKPVVAKVPSVFPFLLASNNVRGAALSTRLSIPESTDFVDLRLDLSISEYGPAQKYEALLTTDGSGDLCPKSRIKYRRSGTFLVMRVPVTCLRRGQHKVILNAVLGAGEIDEVDRYYLDIVRVKQ